MTLGECVTCGAHTSEPKALHALQSPLPRYMMACVLEQGRPKLMAYARMHFPELRQAQSTHSLQAVTFETCGNLLRLLLQIRLRLTQNLWISILFKNQFSNFNYKKVSNRCGSERVVTTACVRCVHTPVSREPPDSRLGRKGHIGVCSGHIG